nr:heavy metal-associated isoprenylated plant protein 47-like [Quercus suber]POE67576.1 heavy metal-associated isoprenylated plant protein 47 [Quercus suber]POE67577.1 heavy metal-associated isoprenylated plant protein 47 [Quercus suber]
MPCDKCRRKAMKIASKANGVNSVAIEGSDRDQLVVIGEGVDSANLTCSLRKKLCYAVLRSVEEVKAKPEPVPKPANKPGSTSSTCSCGCPQLPICPQYPPYPMLYGVKVYDYTPNPSYCPIM